MHHLLTIIYQLFISVIITQAMSFQLLYGSDQESTIVYHEEERPQIITVFIHGTVGAATTLWYGFWLMLADAFDGTSGCEKRVIRERTSPKLKHDEFMLDLGMVKVDPDNLPQNRLHHGAYHIIKAFASCAEASHVDTDLPPNYHYYTFGWSGLLSETGRKNAARELHASLNEEYKRLKTRYNNVTIQLYAHSHGCQLILYLAQANREVDPSQRLAVDYAVLSGAPLYYNAVQLILTGTFKTVLNIYSEGDFIQQLDVLSTPNAFCKRRFSDLLLTMPQPHEPFCTIIDMRIEGEYCPYFFGHFSFFTLNRYAMLKGRNRSYHQAYQTLLNELKPLPLVVLYPLLLPELDHYKQCVKRGIHEATVNLGLCNGRLALALHPTERIQDTKIIYVPDAFYQIRDETRAFYTTFDELNRSSSPIRSR